MNTTARSRVYPRKDGSAFGASWVVGAHWAHPLWDDYLVLLYDLTTPMAKPPKLHMPGVTHEVLVYALDPNHPLPSPFTFDGWQPRYLTPANHGYQFAAPDDAAATARIAAIVDDIDRGVLSPDTDFTSLWDSLFADGVSLKRGAAA